MSLYQIHITRNVQTNVSFNDIHSTLNFLRNEIDRQNEKNTGEKRQ